VARPGDDDLPHGVAVVVELGLAGVEIELLGGDRLFDDPAADGVAVLLVGEGGGLVPAGHQLVGVGRGDRRPRGRFGGWRRTPALLRRRAAPVLLLRG
jgi:hypothetical protein